ncbi:urease accessory protein UreF [Microbulbifer sp. S227A]|uniref:urease accessory protein UreF n=1 Tax=Microbulbifer sp. S227A TaxID=3415131 RepID=UPI003C7B94C0
MAAPIPMPTDTAALLTLAQWLSPAYPVGAFSYSHGLEWAVECGDVVDAAGFGAWLGDILEHGSGRSDAILLTAAYRATRADALAEIDATARALAPSRERLMETALQGRAFATLTSDIWPAPLGDLCYPVAVGAAARMLGLPLAGTLAMYLHAFAGNLTSAAIRLVPLGQTEGQAALAAAAALCQRLVHEAQSLTPDDIGTCCFAADIASMKHETQYSRLFRS